MQKGLDGDGFEGMISGNVLKYLGGCQRITVLQPLISIRKVMHDRSYVPHHSQAATDVVSGSTYHM